MKSKEKVKCDYCICTCIGTQYLFLSDKFPSTNKNYIYLEPLSPKQNYSCNFKVFYDSHEFLNKSETFETDVGSEYITYLLCKISFYVLTVV